MTTQIIDLSALYWRNWHASEGDEVSSARNKTLGFVRSLYSEGEVIVCLDSPPYKRKDIDPEYKANRPARNEAAIEELERCIEEILVEGWKVVRAPGFEADDVIYTICHEMDYEKYVIWGTDKDLLQIGPITEPWSRKTKTAIETLGVPQNKVVDYLSLIGDASDNVKGVKGVGPKSAVAMLEKFGSIDGIYEALDKTPYAFKPKTVENLTEAREWIGRSALLITLQGCSRSLEIEQRERPKTKMEKDVEEPSEPVDAAFEPVKEHDEKSGTSIIKHVTVEALTYERSLEPNSLDEAYKVACAMHESRFFQNKFKTPDALLTIILAGRELGLGAFAAANGIENITGTLAMKAQLMVALVQGNAVCEYIYCSNSDDNSCTWVTRRRGNPAEQFVTLTYAQCEQMGVTKAFNKKTQRVEEKDNWRKLRDVMIMWRCAAKLSRRVYSDLLFGLYAKEELDFGH